MGWSPDVFGLYDNLTAREYVQFFADAYRSAPAKAKARADELLELARLTEFADRPVHVLSRGQKQRLGLTRALVHEPEVLLLDEPASGLDPRSRVELRELLRSLAAAGTAVVVSSHLLGDLEELADRVVFVDRGVTVGEHRLDQLPEGTVARPWRVRALDTDALVAALTRNGYDHDAPTPAGVDVRLANDEAAVALLAGLVRDGVPVVSCQPLGGARGGLPGADRMTPHGVATVAKQEFRLRIRAGRWRWLLSMWFAVLLLFTGLLRGALGGFTQDDVVDKGVVLYGGLMLFVLGLALLVVPALAAQSVNGDRERGTLATLQVTRLSAADICLGKFAAAWGTALVFLGLTLPLVLYAMTQKGVPVTRVVVVTAGARAAARHCVRHFARAVSTPLAYDDVGRAGLPRRLRADHRHTHRLRPGHRDHDRGLHRDVHAGLSGTEQPAVHPVAIRAGPHPAAVQPAAADLSGDALEDRPHLVAARPQPVRHPRRRGTAAAATDRSPEKQRQADARRGISRQDARDLDPLGGLGRAVRGLRKPPVGGDGTSPQKGLQEGNAPLPVERRKPVWPWGLGFDVALAGAALWLTTRRLATPSRRLPKGQRIA